MISKAVTVSQLIEELKKYPPDIPVMTEGCDCIGPCCGTEMMELHNDALKLEPTVVLRRDDT